MKRTLWIILFVNVIICILLSLLTGTFTDTLTMLFTLVFVFIICILSACILSFFKSTKRFSKVMLLNSILLPLIIFIISEVASSCRIHSLYVMYHFNTIDGEYQIYIHKDTNVFDINRIFEDGSEGVIHGTYDAMGNNEYKFHAIHVSSNNNYNELHIKNDSIYGFNGAAYPLELE